MKPIAEAVGVGVLFLVLALLWVGVMSGRLHAVGKWQMAGSDPAPLSGCSGLEACGVYGLGPRLRATSTLHLPSFSIQEDRYRGSNNTQPNSGRVSTEPPPVAPAGNDGGKTIHSPSRRSYMPLQQKSWDSIRHSCASQLPFFSTSQCRQSRQQPSMLSSIQDESRIDILVKLRHQQTYDTHGVQFFALVTKDGEALLSVDGDLPFAQQLHQFVNKRVRIIVEDAEPQRLER